jgi:hypothetical protein
MVDVSPEAAATADAAAAAEAGNEPAPEQPEELYEPAAPGNRRAYYRVPMRRLEARATGISQGRASRFVVRVMDLSGGGALLYSTHAIDQGAVLRLHLPGSEVHAPLDLPAQVVRVERLRTGWKAGIQFTALADSVRDIIVRRVNHEELRRGLGAAH